MVLRWWRGGGEGEGWSTLTMYRIALVRLLVHESTKLSLGFVAASDSRLRSIASCVVLTVELRERGSASNLGLLQLWRSRTLCGRDGNVFVPVPQHSMLWGGANYNYIEALQ